MQSSTTRLGSLTMGLLMASASVAVAAAPDLRLVNAAAQRDKEAVHALVKQGVDVNAATADGATPLLWAAHWDDLDAADLLVRAHANVNAADDHGVTPLALAAENANAAMVEKLLKGGANPNAAQVNGVTPLMIAARTGNLDVVRSLLGGKANVNAAVKETGQTALMWAAAERHLDIMRALVASGANVHAQSTTGFTALLFAARNGDIEAAQVLLAAGVAVNETGSDGTHALPLAIISGQDRFAMFLLDQGADANGQLFGVRALHAAAGDVQMWIRDWLRVRGIDATRSLNPLDPARRIALVKALLAHGADPNARITSSASSQYYLTVKRGAFETFSIGTGDLKGATPLWVAAWSLHDYYVGFGAGNRATTSTHRADVLQVLLAAGANPRLTTDDKTTVLMAAAGLGRLSFVPGSKRGDRSIDAEEGVRILVEAGADVNATNEAKFTALHGAAFRGLDEVIEFLVAHGADINAQDFRERTAFRIAQGAKQSFQWQEWPETAELLKKLGANPELGIDGRVQERQREVAKDAGKQQQ